MNKVLVIISESPRFKMEADILEAENKRFQERSAFIEKQISDLNEAKKKFEDKTHKTIVELLVNTGKLPSDFSDQKDSLTIDLSRDCILWHRHDEQCGHSVGDMLSKLFGPKG